MAKKKEEGNKILINSSVLNKALKDVGVAIETNIVLPILGSVHCTTTKKDMTLMASDMNLTIISKVDCDCSGEFVFLLPFEEIYKITSVLGSQPIEIIVGESITIKGDSGKFELGKAESTEHFPRRKELEEKYRTTIDADFIKAMQKAKSITSTVQLEVVFNNVLIDIDEKHAVVVATDRHNMIRYRQPSKGGILKALVTVDFVKAIANMKEAELFGNDDFITAKSGNLEVIDRTALVSNYPDYKRLFDNYESNCELTSSDLLHKLNEILIFKNSFHICKMYFTKGEIRIAYDDDDTNKHYENNIKAAHSVNAEKVYFNARNLKDLLSLLDDENVHVSIADNKQPVHLDGADGKTFLFIMPLVYEN